MKIDAVFEGGGMKFIGLVGAACCLEDRGYEWNYVAGTSSGSIVAALLAAGYKASELKEILMNIDCTEFLDKNKIPIISPIKKTTNLLRYKGLHSGDPLEEFISQLLEEKGKAKFKDVTEDGKSRLKIIASDITRRKMLILSEDIKSYGIDPMELKIAQAIRMSISIPFYFKPVKLYYKDKVSYIVDGGILSKFPIWIFDVYGVPRWPTIGFKLVSKKVSHTAEGKTDFSAFIFDIFDTMIEKNEDIYIRDKDAVRTIFIPTLGVQTTQFNIPKEMKIKLFDSGYKSAEKFLNSWDFQQYIKKYRG